MLPGASVGTNDLAQKIFMGGSGGTGSASFGAAGGGIIYIHAKDITVGTGTKIEAIGGFSGGALGNGGGAGGAIHIVTETITGTLNLDVGGGDGEDGNASTYDPGGGGAGGRIHTVRCSGNGGNTGSFVANLLGGLGGLMPVNQAGGDGQEGTDLAVEPGC